MTRIIALENLRKSLGKELKDLPFIITNRGINIAIVKPYSSNNLTVETNLTVQPYGSGEINHTVEIPTNHMVQEETKFPDWYDKSKKYVRTKSYK